MFQQLKEGRCVLNLVPVAFEPDPKKLQQLEVNWREIAKRLQSRIRLPNEKDVIVWTVKPYCWPGRVPADGSSGFAVSIRVRLEFGQESEVKNVTLEWWPENHYNWESNARYLAKALSEPLGLEFNAT